MAVLECLARANGQVVSRNEILEAVWPGADVTDDVLTHSVTELRKAFGDSPHDPEVIETIPKKGLRLMLDVASIDESVVDSSDADARQTAISATPRIGLLLAVIIVVGLSAAFYFLGRDAEVRTGAGDTGKAIAVLPFVDTSPDEDQQYLADSLSTELSNRLSQVDGLLVYGPRFSQLLGGTSRGDRDAERKIALDYTLDGSVCKSDGDLRINVLLSEFDAGQQLWSHTFERPYAEWFEVQDDIALLVAEALSVELGVGNSNRRVGGTSNIAAFEQVRLGDSLYDFTRENMARAIAHYSHAARLDPNYAIAWERIAMYYNEAWIVEGRTAIDKYSDLADVAIENALSVGPDSESVLLTAAEIQLNRQNYIAARRLFDRAEALYPDPNEVLLGQRSWHSVHWHMFSMPGNMDDLIRRLEAARRINSLPQGIGSILPHAYLSVGRFDDAVAELDRASAPQALNAGVQLRVLTALALDDKEQVRQWLTVLAERDDPAAPAMLDRLFDRERALEWLAEAYTTDADLDYYVVAWASYYGDDALALAAMRRSRDTWMFWLPLTAHLRSTDEFKSIVLDMGMVDYWREYGWNDYCAPDGEDDFRCS